jgi:hypothetical protein
MTTPNRQPERGNKKKTPCRLPVEGFGPSRNEKHTEPTHPNRKSGVVQSLKPGSAG